jgi:site-specific recombinase XerD
MIIRGKGSKERTVFLTPGAEECLQNWLAQRSSIPDEHVFISYQRKKLSTTSINVRIQRTCQTSGVRLTAHRLRHTFADHLLSAGMPITSIQKLMGHRFVETTQNYAVANDRQVQADFYKACEKLEGWQLLTDAAQSSHTEITWKAQERRENVDAIYTRILTPNHVLSLPNELVRQLESYRQLKANRWRPERVESNSILFYSKQGILWKFFCEICAVRSVSDLRLDHVLQFIQARLDAGRSARTINCSLSSLRSFLTFLREDGVPIDPSLEHIQRLKENERLPRYITSEQVKRLRNEVEETVSKAPDLLQKQSALMMRSVFYLLWQGGLRSGEIEMLRFSDFYISKAKQAKRLFIRDSKWRKGRAVYLTDVALEALKEYLAVRGMDQGGDFVFVRDGMPLKKNFLAGRIKAIGRQADVSVSPHRLRHTFATQLLNVGCKVTSIQKLLGHTDLNTTMTYARAFDQTVMLDYFQAVDVIESQPGGSWYQLNEVVL